MAESTTNQLPKTYKGLLFTSADVDPEITSLPTPTTDPGSVIVRPLYAWIVGYANQIMINGNERGYPVPFPLVGGSHAIGRVAAVGPDSTKLKIGDLVSFEPHIRSRDDPDSQILLALMHGATEETKKLATEVWRHGAWAELVKAPLENVQRFDEAAIKRQGFEIRDLAFFGSFMVPYGGLRDVNLTAGETILISPATGGFGGAAVHVALAMGARVIAMGRNEEVLRELKALSPGRVETVKMSGNVETDVAAIAEHGTIDVFLDLTPPMAANKTDHIRAGLLSLRTGGRMSLMGGVPELTIPYGFISYKNITIKGTHMYTKEQTQDMIKLIETGTLKLGEKAGLKIKGVFKLEEWAKALELAGKETGAGRAVVFAPNEE